MHVLAAARDLYLEAILAGRRTAAVDVAVGAVERGMDVRDVYVDVLQHSLYEVGRLWEENRISVAAEHLATAITQRVLARLYGLLERPAAIRGRVVLTGVAGELHQLGGHMVADGLEGDGWDVRFLGANVGIRDVLTAIDEHTPAVVGISCTMPQSLTRVALLIESIRTTYGSTGPRIVLGGGAFRAAPTRVSQLGGDAFANDLRTAIEVTRALTGAVAT